MLSLSLRFQKEGLPALALRRLTCTLRPSRVKNCAETRVAGIRRVLSSAI